MSDLHRDRDKPGWFRFEVKDYDSCQAEFTQWGSDAADARSRLEKEGVDVRYRLVEPPESGS